NMPVTLIDDSPKRTAADWDNKLHQRDARVYALSLASIKLLEDIGAWQKIVASGRKADYTQMQVWQRDGIGELLFGENELGGNDSKGNSMPQRLRSMVEPAVIEYALWQGLRNPAISEYLTVIAGQQVVQMDWQGAQQGYRVTLDDKTVIEAKLLVGADG